MALVYVVKPQYGPTLLELVGTLPRGRRLAAIALLALLIAAALAIAIRSRPDETELIVRGPATFNLVHGSQLQRVSQPGALLALRRERNGLFLDSYVVRALRLASYRGVVGGTLPVYADAYIKRLLRRYGTFELAFEGRTRINNAIGYQIALRAERDERALFVRHVLLFPDKPEGARDGVVVELESTYGAGTPNAIGTGNFGPIKQPLRSFRFGTERKGAQSD